MKKLFFLFSSFLIIVFLLPFSYAEDLTNRATEDVTEVVEVVLNGNDGIRALGIDVLYDSDALKLNNAQNADSGLLSGFLFAQNTTDRGCSFAWIGSEESDANGTILRLVFTVKGEESFPVSAEAVKASTIDEQEKPILKTVRVDTLIVSAADQTKLLDQEDMTVVSDYPVVAAASSNQQDQQSVSVDSQVTVSELQNNAIVPLGETATNQIEEVSEGSSRSIKTDSSEARPWVVLIVFLLILAAAAISVWLFRRRKND